MSILKLLMICSRTNLKNLKKTEWTILNRNHDNTSKKDKMLSQDLKLIVLMNICSRNMKLKASVKKKWIMLIATLPINDKKNLIEKIRVKACNINRLFLYLI